MQTKRGKMKLTAILCMVSLVAMTLFTTGCNGSAEGKEPAAPGTETTNQTGNQTDSTDNDLPPDNAEAKDSAADGDDAKKNASSADTDNKSAPADSESKDSKTASADKDKTAPTDSKVIGEGSTVFDFTVVDRDGNETKFEIHTDKEMVGDALQELELIDGDESEYGLFVNTVNGITADYDKDGVYWAFYINDEYAQTGVSATAITEGDSYSFRVE